MVDASVAVAWFVNEPGSERADRLLEDGLRLLAPDILAVEAAGAWSRKAQHDEMSPDDVLSALSDLRSLGLVWTAASDLLAEALELSLKLTHPVVDCVYIALARRSGAPIASDDRQLGRAALLAGVKMLSG